MKSESKSLVIFTVAGIIFGYASFVLNKAFSSSIIPLILTIVLFYALTLALNKVLKINEKAKWFLSNGGLVYFFMWFVTWILLYNVM